MSKRKGANPWLVALAAMVLAGGCIYHNSGSRRAVPRGAEVAEASAADGHEGRSLQGDGRQGDGRQGGGLPASGDDSAAADSCLTFAMPVTPRGVPEQILRNEAYVSSFNNTTLMPNWVAWRLTAAHASGKVERGDMKFTPDDRVGERWRVTTYDYMRSGFDRGHMCPAGDNKWSEEAMRQCFLLTNICPQDHGLNVGDWNEMENQCRRWAKEYGEIYVVCGPVLYRGRHRRIGREHKVTVPEAFFKVVLCVKGDPWAVGLIYKNADGDRPKGDYQNSIGDIERITGLRFFPRMPEKVRENLRTMAL